MIGKITCPRGRRAEPLIWYLYGPGRRHEHADPHIVAGWRHPAELEPPIRADGSRDFRRLHGLLGQPCAALGPRGYDRPVWHCSLRAAPGDRLLSDGEWAHIAADVMHRTGLAPHGQDDDAVRWIAVRHAPDHMLDEGTYLGSVSTYYRVLREAGESRERRAQAAHPAAVKPELVATGPNQVYSWDITKLHGPAKWTITTCT